MALNKGKSRVVAGRPTVAIDWWDWRHFGVRCPRCGKGGAKVDLNIPEMQLLHGSFSYQPRLVELDCPCSGQRHMYQAIFPVVKDGKNGNFEIDKEKSCFVRLGYVPKETAGTRNAIIRSLLPPVIKREQVFNQDTRKGCTNAWLKRGDGSSVEIFSIYKSGIELAQRPLGPQHFDNWTVEALGDGEFWDVTAFRVRAWKAMLLAKIMDYDPATDMLPDESDFDQFAHPVKQAAAACVWKHSFVQEQPHWLEQLDADIEEAADHVSMISRSQGYDNTVANSLISTNSLSSLLQDPASPSWRPSRNVGQSFASINAEIDAANGKTFGGWFKDPELHKREQAMQKLEWLKGLKERIRVNNDILQKMMPPDDAVEMAIYIGESSTACNECQEYTRRANERFDLDMRIVSAYPPGATVVEEDADFDMMSEDGTSYYGSQER